MDREAAQTEITRAIGLVGERKLAEALAVIDRVADAGWFGRELWFLKAALEFELRRNEAAERSLAAVVGYDPRFGGAFALVAQLRLSLRDLVGATKAAEEAARLAPESPYVLTTEARLLEVRAALSESPSLLQAAINRWEKALRIDPQNPVWQSLYADFLLRHGRFRAARVHASAAAEIAPNWFLPHAVLAATNLAEGDRKAAKDNFERARTLSPDRRYVKWLEAQIDAPGGAALQALFAWANWMFRDPSRARLAFFIPGMLAAVTVAWSIYSPWWLVVCGLSAAPLAAAVLGVRLQQYVSR